MTFTPDEHYDVVLRKGMKEWEVWAIQIALAATHGPANLVLDGDFGPATLAAVKMAQEDLSIPVDGVCGPQTMAAICYMQCQKAQVGKTPKGLPWGVCKGESDGIITTVSPLYPNKTRDYSSFQDNKPAPATEVQLLVAFNPKLEARLLAQHLYTQYSIYRQLKDVSTDEQAWRLSVLHYNWPVAADHIAAGQASTWQYVDISTGKVLILKLSDPAPWVEKIGVKGVTTGQQWCDFYINTKVKGITDWSIAK